MRQLTGEQEENTWLCAGDIVSPFYEGDGSIGTSKSKLEVWSMNGCMIEYLGYNNVVKVVLDDVTRYIPPTEGDVVKSRLGKGFYEGVILWDKGQWFL